MSNDSESQTEDVYIVPSAKAIKNAIKDSETIERNYVLKPTNFADKADTVKAYQKNANDHFKRNSTSSTRDDLITYMKNADGQYRLSKDNHYSDNSTQESNTLSNVVSPQFYNSIKRIWTGLANMIFGDGQELPAKYKKIADCEDYSTTEGERVAKEQTLEFEATYRKNKWDIWMKESMRWLCKNAHEFIGLEWSYETDTKTERVPGFYTKNGMALETRQETKQDIEGNDYKQTIVVSTGAPYNGYGFDAYGKPITDIYDENGRPES